ncbi:dynein light chain Tctex-type 5-like [Ptychodera flava]|uniref:dynein light chain Tctex-type 5-like n=1 Tax=Ptychodera flava TaxID=63121 RepID=UPI003969FDDA
MKAMLTAAARNENKIPQQPSMERQKSATSIISKLSNSSATTAATGGGGDTEKADKPIKLPMNLFAKRPSMWNSVNKLLTKEKPPAPVRKLENTYRMEPQHEYEFKSQEVRGVIEDIFKIRLKDETYEQKRANNLARNLAEVIKIRVKKLNMPRHKLVVFCVIGSRQEQCLRLGSRCVWDDKTDDFASASYQNGSIFAVATVYGIYFE